MITEEVDSEDERDRLGFKHGTWANWAGTFAWEFFTVALIFPLVLKLLWHCATLFASSCCPRFACVNRDDRSPFATEYLLVETIKRVPQGLIAYCLLVIRVKRSWYDSMTADDPAFLDDPTFAEANKSVLLSEVWYPFLAFLFVAVLRAHDEASFNRHESDSEIMQHSSMRSWFECLKRIREQCNIDSVNNKIDKMDHELREVGGFRFPTKAPDDRRFAELQQTFIEGFHFERGESVDERWKDHKKPIAKEAVIRRIKALRESFTRTDAVGYSGPDPADDIEEGELPDKPYLPAHFVARMIVELSLKDGRLHRKRGWWIVFTSSLLHAAIPPIWRVAIAGIFHEHCYVNGWDWMGWTLTGWTLTGCMHMLSFAVNFTVTFSIAVRMFKCYADFYVRYRRMLYLLHLCPWSTMKQTRRVDSFGMLPTFHLGSITNIEAWNKMRIFLQRFEIEKTRRTQTSVVYMLVAWVGIAIYHVLKYLDRHDGESLAGLMDTAAFIVYSTTAQLAVGLTLIISCGSKTNELQAHGFQHMLQIKQAEVISSSSNFLVEREWWRSLHETTNHHHKDSYVYVGKQDALYAPGEQEVCKAIYGKLNENEMHRSSSGEQLLETTPSHTAEVWLQSNSMVGLDQATQPQPSAQTLHDLRCHHLLSNLIDTVRSESTSGARDHWAGEDRRAKLIFIHLNDRFVAGLWTSILSVLGPGIYAVIQTFTNLETESAGSGIGLTEC
jgi:hypothetical protein